MKQKTDRNIYEVPKISIEKILNSGTYPQALKIKDKTKLRILVDTSSIKHIPLDHKGQALFCHKAEDGKPYQIYMTHRGVREMNNNSHLIPWQLKNYMYSISKRVIDARYEPQDYKEITEWHEEWRQDKDKKPISVADIKLLSTGMRWARRDEQTILLADDMDILSGVSYLRKKSPERKIFKEHMLAIPLAKAINSLYEIKPQKFPIWIYPDKSVN